VRTLFAEPLSAEAFAPFGEVLTPPAAGDPRRYFERALANARPHARPSLSLVRVDEADALPIEPRRMERHVHSSQSFVPLGAATFLVLVAPPAGGGPDVARARAFVAAGGQGVTYAADTWHHPLTVLAAPASFAVWMWRDGTADDEEFADVEGLRIAR